MAYGAHVQGNASLTSTASGSITIFASATSARWTLTKGAVTVVGAGVGARLELYEVTDASTGVRLLAMPIVTNQLGYYPLDLGDHGYTASQTESRLVAQVAGANASVNMIFVGYRR